MTSVFRSFGIAVNSRRCGEVFVSGIRDTGRGVGDPLDGRAAVVVAPARSFHVPLTDGEGRVCRLADYSERPAGAGHRAVDREYADGSLPVVRDLDDERDQRWERDVAGFLVHAAGLVVGWDAQDEASVVVCGPRVDGVLDPGSDAFAPSLGRDRDPLDHAAASFEGLRCIVRPSRREVLGVLAVWHDERASYQAVLGPRPYKRRPVQILRVRDGLWRRLVPSMLDLFGQKVPDHVCLHLVRRRDDPYPGCGFVPLGRSVQEILESSEKPHDDNIPTSGDGGQVRAGVPGVGGRGCMMPVEG